MDRETFKILAYGQFCFTHLQDSIEKEPMQKFVDGALWAWDFRTKEEIEDKLCEPISWNIKPPDITYTERN